MAWLSGWSYRRKITISGSSGAGTNYQVLLRIGESSGATGCDFHLDGKSANFPSGTNQGGDLRFTADDGITPLGFWVETVQGTSPNRIAYVWVKVSSDLETNQEIYCYFGNAAASNGSSITNTFIREIDGAQPVKGSWHLDEGSGTLAYDSSGNNNNGTLNNCTWVDGKFKKALDFDGSTSYVQASSLNVSYLTIAAWVKWDQFFADSRGHAVVSNSNLAADGYMLYQNTSSPYNKIKTFVYASSLTMLTSVATLNTGTWYHVAVTYDGSALKLYINGSLDTQVAGSGTIGATTNPLLFGSTYTTDGGKFDGQIDEIHIFNRALSAQEIADLYNYYGYTTTNYPGRVLVRKYVSPEPAFSSASGIQVLPSSRRLFLMPI